MFAETVTLNTLTRFECKFNIGNNYASNLGKFTFLSCIVGFLLFIIIILNTWIDLFIIYITLELFTGSNYIMRINGGITSSAEWLITLILWCEKANKYMWTTLKLQRKEKNRTYLYIRHVWYLYSIFLA